MSGPDLGRGVGLGNFGLLVCVSIRKRRESEGVNTGFDDVFTVRLFTFVLGDEDTDVLFSSFDGCLIVFGMAGASN